MTTLSFPRKNNLLSLLRGYDLPIKRNYLNAALLGYGKKEKEKENIYENFRDTVVASLKTCYNSFRNHIEHPTKKFWHRAGLYNGLCVLTRYYVAGYSKTYGEFMNNIDGFLSEIVQSKRYINLLKLMDAYLDLQHKSELTEKEKKEYELLEEAYNTKKENSKQEILSLTYRFKFQIPTTRDVINLILACIVYSIKNPEDFERNFNKYIQTVQMYAAVDVDKIFNINLEDTASKDDDESEGEPDSEDEEFVVPDDYVEYVEKPAKRRKLVADDDDDDEEEDEVNGSGFYDWWW